MGRTTTVDLGDLKSYADGLIESGDYNTQSEMVRESLRLLREKHAKSQLAGMTAVGRIVVCPSIN